VALGQQHVDWAQLRDGFFGLVLLLFGLVLDGAVLATAIGMFVQPCRRARMRFVALRSDEKLSKQNFNAGRISGQQGRVKASQLR